MPTIPLPLSDDTPLILVRGDDYSNADSRALEWTNGSDWPDLTGATIKFGVIREKTKTETTGSVITPTGSTKKVRVELTASFTGSLVPGTYAYDVQATLSNAHVVTLVRAPVIVLDDVT